jgi:hypothetical protein
MLFFRDTNRLLKTYESKEFKSVSNAVSLLPRNLRIYVDKSIPYFLQQYRKKDVVSIQ